MKLGFSKNTLKWEVALFLSGYGFGQRCCFIYYTILFYRLCLCNFNADVSGALFIETIGSIIGLIS